MTQDEAQTHETAALRIAFELRIMGRIVRADRRILPFEQAVLEDRYPDELLIEHGLQDPEHLHSLGDLAGPILEQRLSQKERLGMIALFADVARVDGHEDVDEIAIVLEAARLLGLCEADLGTVEHLFQRR